MNRFSLHILVWFSMAFPCIGASINLSNLDPRDFTTNGTAPAVVGVNLNSSQFSHTVSGITIVGAGAGNLITSGTASAGNFFVFTDDTHGYPSDSVDNVLVNGAFYLPFASASLVVDGNSNVVSAGLPIWTNSPTGTAALQNGVTEISAPGTVYANDAYLTNDCSALTFTDRSSSPDSLEDAYRIVQSHATRNGRVDHGKLNRLAWGHDKKGQPDPSSRDIGMVLSAQQMVIQDLLTRIEKLEKK